MCDGEAERTAGLLAQGTHVAVGVGKVRSGFTKPAQSGSPADRAPLSCVLVEKPCPGPRGGLGVWHHPCSWAGREGRPRPSCGQQAVGRGLCPGGQGGSHQPRLLKAREWPED